MAGVFPSTAATILGPRLPKSQWNLWMGSFWFDVGKFPDNSPPTPAYTFLCQDQPCWLEMNRLLHFATRQIPKQRPSAIIRLMVSFPSRPLGKIATTIERAENLMGSNLAFSNRRSAGYLGNCCDNPLGYHFGTILADFFLQTHSPEPFLSLWLFM